MHIYLPVFIVSACLIYIGERAEKKSFMSLCSLIGILLPCLIASLRANSIGTDVMVYGISSFEDALNSVSFSEYFNLMTAKKIEIGFIILNYFFSRFFSSHHAIFFFYQLIIDGCVFLGLKKLSTKWNFPVWLSMLLFYFALYNRSLNIMRQCMAVGIVFLGLSFLLVNQNYFVFLLGILLGMSFHETAFLGLIYIPMEFCFRLKYNDCLKKKLCHFSILLIIIALGILIAPYIIRYFVDLKLLKNAFLGYLDGGKYSNIGKEIDPRYICFVVPEIFFCILLLINSKKIDRNKISSIFLIVNTFILWIIDFAPYYATYLSRLGYYFVPLQCAAMALIPAVNEGKYKKGYTALLIAAYGFIWFVIFIVVGSAETVPYLFYWE